MPPALLLIPEAVELGEAAYGAYRIYRLARAAQAVARAAQAARRLQQAAEAANTMLQSQAAVKGCATCPKEEIPCFNTPENGTNEEMDRQLKEQQDAINNMSPEQLLDNPAKNRDAAGKIVRPPGDASSRSSLRTEAETTLREQLRRRYIDERGLSPREAIAAAAADAKQQMRGQQMLHTPDLRAGGDGTLSTTPGSGSVNQSIGAQWNTKGTGEKTRGAALEQEAENAKARGDEKMDVDLERCKEMS